MSDRLHKQVAVEREQLHRLLEVHRPLLTQCAASAPSDIERSALAAMLHAFYTGVENLLKRVAIEYDGAVPGGASWHRELLNAMARPSDRRHAVISAALRDRLKEYLEFRHVFRQAYSFQLEWKKMAPLVAACQDTLGRIEHELDAFFGTPLAPP
jgi:hypothetical protein